MKPDLKRSAAHTIAIGLAVAALLAGQSHESSAHSGTPEEQAACTSDVLSLCLFEISSEDRIVACLNRNLDRLSPACRTVIAGPPAKKNDRDKH